MVGVGLRSCVCLCDVPRRAYVFVVVDEVHERTMQARACSCVRSLCLCFVCLVSGVGLYSCRCVAVRFCVYL